ncbi:MAG TPA: OmpH family outer membrane protein [Ignavibacteriaceae bacterium]|jgi:outer membrane protein|nr:MAG: periplasmic chaperone [Ignavibacteria bacterium ADurb.Bin266]OQY73342.1 MAG: molecular chaperone Skp [Ignavibacteriales bacterium UTCHB2]HQF41920.1 OmpH family outer membrane protein [Ignavibacteriaceae bacterium]HQI41175.1 OmpH family outer membrane protein [Ignavibacteriaceae bacterium]HQJ45691.1 OmpH family outer membrane protein [Ignavibacteriaceae bacterium]
MKKIIIASIFILVSSISFAQLKIGYIDSDTIMDQLPDVQDARQKLDALIQEWQGELNKMENEWKTKYDDYEKRKLIMSDQTRAETEAALVKLETDMAQYREKKFGTNGELFQKQDELMKPVQNKIFIALKELAEQEDFDFVFDRSGDIMILFAKEKYDLTSRVLDRLKLK